MSTTGPRIKECLDRVIDTFSRRPSAAMKEDSPATAMWNGGLSTRVLHPSMPQTGTDMPEVLGGKGEAPPKLEADGAPDEILRDIVSTAQSRAPMSSALRSSIDVPLELHVQASAGL